MNQQALTRIQDMLSEQGYITESSIVMSIYLAMELGKPLSGRRPGRGRED